MAKLKIVTAGGAPGADYEFEKEGLAGLDAEIVESPPGSEEEFLRHAREADAVYGRGGQITKRMIDGLQRCKVISVGSVGVDYIDVAAATASRNTLTNRPDTINEEITEEHT